MLKKLARENTRGGENMKKLLVLCSLVVMLMGLTAFSATAALITGGISFSGNYALNGPLSTATAFTSFTNVVVQSGSGTWAAVPMNTTATFNSFTFAPVGTNVTPLWSFAFGGVTYSLNALGTSMAFVREGGAIPGLDVTGMGTIIASAGFDPTPGAYKITAQTGGATFSFSSSSVALPEPGALIFLGSSLLGLALTGARKKFRK